MPLLLAQDPNAAAGKFGFPVDNTIGATPQPNGWMDNWVREGRGAWQQWGKGPVGAGGGDTQVQSGSLGPTP